jgi:hypothetical protein
VILTEVQLQEIIVTFHHWMELITQHLQTYETHHQRHQQLESGVNKSVNSKKKQNESSERDKFENPELEDVMTRVMTTYYKLLIHIAAVTETVSTFSHTHTHSLYFLFVRNAHFSQTTEGKPNQTKQYENLTKRKTKTEKRSIQITRTVIAKLF